MVISDPSNTPSYERNEKSEHAKLQVRDIVVEYQVRINTDTGELIHPPTPHSNSMSDASIASEQRPGGKGFARTHESKHHWQPRSCTKTCFVCRFCGWEFTVCAELDIHSKCYVQWIRSIQRILN